MSWYAPVSNDSNHTLIGTRETVEELRALGRSFGYAYGTGNLEAQIKFAEEQISEVKNLITTLQAKKTKMSPEIARAMLTSIGRAMPTYRDVAKLCPFSENVFKKFQDVYEWLGMRSEHEEGIMTVFCEATFLMPFIARLADLDTDADERRLTAFVNKVEQNLDAFAEYMLKYYSQNKTIRFITLRNATSTQEDFANKFKAQRHQLEQFIADRAYPDRLPFSRAIEKIAARAAKEPVLREPIQDAVYLDPYEQVRKNLRLSASTEAGDTTSEAPPDPATSLESIHHLKREDKITLEHADKAIQCVPPEQPTSEQLAKVKEDGGKEKAAQGWHMERLQLQAQIVSQDKEIANLKERVVKADTERAEAVKSSTETVTKLEKESAEATKSAMENVAKLEKELAESIKLNESLKEMVRTIQNAITKFVV
ncbi:hypothetical protein EUX98_g3742 [Antrodiella citrinella]|uniref:Uncharacterized protein n=1 Tax=Antrodiella citrinella TaxID=2447956 RepID=A0A4S4MVR7_9APHY|nr:hypothetical protein EUX98_g3742 [Antrodiella citrinella]